MRRDFDIFEKLPDHSFVWRACVSGSYEAQRKLQQLEEHSENEFFAIDMTDGDVVPFILARSKDQHVQIKNAGKRVA